MSVATYLPSIFVTTHPWQLADHFSIYLFLVENQVKPLLAVERETSVARNQRQMLRYGVGYYNVV